MENIYWNVNKPYETCKIFQNNDINDMNEEYLNNVIFMNDNIIRKISLPLNYYSNKESYEIELFNDRQYTIKDILIIIYDFYNNDFTEEELNFISNLHNTSITILEKDYTKMREEYNILLSNIVNHKNKKRYDLLGSKLIFEGLFDLKDNRYKLLLGY
jgi:hypothetical protein